MNSQKLLPTHYLLFAILIMVALHFLFPGAIIVPLEGRQLLYQFCTQIHGSPLVVIIWNSHG